ncbi:F420-dependent NADP oxidoreductase [Flavobacteriaceae bacterium]|nr:F420-dependent NADP oxidoreductase [Flavobacteriaceae bacterium]
MYRPNHLDVILIGTGNLAYSLAQIFQNHAMINLKGIYSKSPKTLNDFPFEVNPLSELNDDADIIILAVSDNAISEVSTKLTDKKGLVVHCAGGKSIQEIQCPNRGVWYPPISFSKGQIVDFKNCSFCLEATNTQHLLLLQKLSELIGASWNIMDSEKRLKLHTAAVFANNFTNQIWTMTEEYCERNNINFELLHPLIKEGTEKALAMGPKKAQTGPALRNDHETLKRHLELLNSKEANFYRIMTQLIQDTHGTQL